MLGDSISNAINNVGQLGQNVFQFGQGIVQNLPQFELPNFQFPQAPSLSDGNFGEGVNNFFQNLPLIGSFFNRPPGTGR